MLSAILQILNDSTGYVSLTGICKKLRENYPTQYPSGGTLKPMVLEKIQQATSYGLIAAQKDKDAYKLLPNLNAVETPMFELQLRALFSDIQSAGRSAQQRAAFDDDQESPDVWAPMPDRSRSRSARVSRNQKSKSRSRSSRRRRTVPSRARR